VKNHDFTPKNHFFFNFRGGARAEWAPPPPWICPCSLQAITRHSPQATTLRLPTTSDHAPITLHSLQAITLRLRSTHYKRSLSTHPQAITLRLLNTSHHSPITLHSLQAITHHKWSHSDYSALIRVEKYRSVLACGLPTIMNSEFPKKTSLRW
jgi:hypothetical protein